MSRRSTILAICLLLALAPGAQAAYPGDNGLLAFTRETVRTGVNGFQYVADSIWVAPPGGPPAELIYSERALLPSWSPDGARIAYLDNPTFRPFGETIYIARAAGQVDRSLPVPGLSVVSRPSWSPDAHRLVFAAWRITESGQPSYCSRDGVWPTSDRRACDLSIYSIATDGTGLTRIASGFDPAWSPDGTRIAFSAYAAAGSEIFTMRPDGTQVVQLTSNAYRDEEPAWSPDGLQLAFTSDRNGPTAGFPFGGGPGEIYTMQADGTDVRRLTVNPALDSSPAWSPDGTRIAFATTRRTPGCTESRFGPDACSSDVYTIKADGTGPVLGALFGWDVDWQPVPVVNHPPDCSAVQATPAVLRLANHHSVTVTVTGATDPDGDPVTLSITGVTQDEPVKGKGDNTVPDSRPVSAPDAIDIRAERAPQGDGRVYRIEFIAVDPNDGQCSGTAVVSVPRYARTPAIDSAPPSYGSGY